VRSVARNDRLWDLNIADKDGAAVARQLRGPRRAN